MACEPDQDSKQVESGLGHESDQECWETEPSVASTQGVYGEPCCTVLAGDVAMDLYRRDDDRVCRLRCVADHIADTGSLATGTSGSG